MSFPKWTYQDLATKLQLHPRVVSRWVVRLEKKGKLRPYRPTRRTVRLTNEDVQVLLTLRNGRLPT